MAPRFAALPNEGVPSSNAGVYSSAHWRRSQRAPRAGRCRAACCAADERHQPLRDQQLARDSEILVMLEKDSTSLASWGAKAFQSTSFGKSGAGGREPPVISWCI